MLTLYRRHLKTCMHYDEGSKYLKCGCPIWGIGVANGKHIRQSLKTRDMQRAIRLAEHLERPNSERSDLIPCAQPGCNVRVERGRCEMHRKSIPGAIQAFHEARPDLGHGTKRNYKRILKYLEAHAAKLNLQMIDEVQPESIDAFRIKRGICALTWTKELQILRNFFNFCVDREWTVRNPASKVAMPKNIQPTDKEPYTQNEMVKILVACDTFGRYPYERLRARAMVLALRYTALRISDVATLGRDRIRNSEIYLRTLKNGKVVKLPIHPELLKALALVPVPRGASGESRYFFWSGNGTVRATIRDATRTLAAVFKASGVAGAHPHRFRHTLATELLGAGASFEEVADILGNSPNIVRKYYAKWSSKRQDRISTLLNSVFGVDSAAIEPPPPQSKDIRQ